MGPLSSYLRGKDNDQDGDASNKDSNNGSNHESNDSPDVVSPPSIPDTIDLARCIRSAIGQVMWRVARRHLSSVCNAPILRKGVINHILVYRRSFDPLHVGHKTLLTHAFFRSSYENIAAALIMPRNDEQLEERMAVSDKGETPAIVLTRSQRAGLWQDNTMM
jgi:hypothetical protein